MTVRVMNERDWELLRRQHVRNIFDWNDAVGTDFWMQPGPAIAGATTFLLSNRGWTTTALSINAGSGADFASAADKGTPRTVSLGASGDLIQGPAVFGDYQHARVAQLLMGEKILPRYLILDAFAAFTTASANETTSGFGLYEDDATISTADDALAVIYSDGTNFGLRSGADSDAGAVVDNNYHWWRIVIDRSISAVTDGVQWYMDGVSQGTIDREADEFPAYFGAHTLTTNRIALGTTHIYYAWDLRNLDQLTA